MSDRLSFLDTSFLAQERPEAPLQLGGLGIFQGLAPADVSATLQRRLHRVPLARSRVHEPTRGGGGLIWVDDDDFDLSYHLRHAALPQPGDMSQLCEYVARLIARPLDRSRPLWELYVIEGVEGGRTALFRKLHLAMAGRGEGDPFAVLLDDTPEAPDAGKPPQRWEPSAPPSGTTLVREAAGDLLHRARTVGTGVAQGARSLVADPAGAVRGVAGAVGAAAGVALRLVSSAPPSPLNTELSPHRRYVTVKLPLDDFRTVRRRVGSTFNDVVLAVTADAVGRLLRWRGHDTKDLDLRVMVPVRVDDSPTAGAANVAGESGAVGVLAPLPVMQLDPVARLYRVMGEMVGVTESRQAVAADSLLRLAGYGPAGLHAMAARVASAQQRYNLAVSNAPGPQTPRYLAGVRLDETYPFIPLAGDSALTVAVNSYAGQVFFGLLGDRDAMSDLDLLGDFYDEALADLVDAARKLNR